MKWSYKSPIGMLYIVLNANNRYYIVINEQYYGSYHSAVAAADDVFTFSTGCDEWDEHAFDSLYQDHVPSDITEWTRLG